MKTTSRIIPLAAFLAAATLTGCDNKKTSSTETATPPPTAVPAPPAVPDTKPVAAQVDTAATNAVSAVKSKADEMIAQAKSYIADKKYTEALDALNKVSGLALTPEQQQTVTDLKDQVQKMLSSGTGTADAAKSLLGK